LVRKCDEKRSLAIHRHKWGGNIRIEFKEIKQGICEINSYGLR
jgi:hypothetical protein